MTQITGFEAQFSSNPNSSSEISEDENEIEGSACSIFEDDESMVIELEDIEESEDITGNLISLTQLNHNV